MTHEEHKAIIRQLYLTQSLLLTGKKPDQAESDAFVDEIAKLDPLRSIPAMKVALMSNSIPTVADIQKRCGAVVQTKSHVETVEEKKLALEELTFRMEAPFPQCTDLDASSAYWQESILRRRDQGWSLEMWDEYDGLREFPGGGPGDPPKGKQRIYYAYAHMSKRPNAKLSHCKNHFDGRVRAIYNPT